MVRENIGWKRLLFLALAVAVILIGASIRIRRYPSFRSSRYYLVAPWRQR